MKTFPLLITVAVAFQSDADGMGDLQHDLIHFAKSLKERYPNITFSELASYSHKTKKAIKHYQDGGALAYVDKEGGL